MTKFVSDAKGTASGRAASSMSGKERKKNLEKFVATGEHPYIQTTTEDNKASALKCLPPVDLNRVHVFLDFKHGNKQLCRVVIELFDDLCPVAAAAFKNRCLEGQHTLRGTCVHKLLPRFAIHGGGEGGESAVTKSRATTGLQHVEAGIVSVSRTGQGFTITLNRALQLDAENEVIGRIVKPDVFLEQVRGVEIEADDTPVRALTVMQCGVTDRKGTFETLSATNLAPKTGKEASTALQQDLDGARETLAEALEAGLKRKAPSKLVRPGVKRGMLQASLPDDLSDSSDSDVEGT